MTDSAQQNLTEKAIMLLQQLISQPSYSREEAGTAAILETFFRNHQIPFQRKENNLWAKNKHFDPNLPTILLNSHHDTVKPNAGYTREPFDCSIVEGKLYGLGSNDAGGCLVSLLLAFTYFYDKKLPFNLIMAATAEEEISGKMGIACVLPELPELELAIVGEPTLLRLAVAEKGLMVIDATVKGKAGHAAREEGVNAIYEALADLNTLRDFHFQKESLFLGKSKASVTIINAGSQHNVVPDTCTYTIDVRVTDAYTLEEALEELKSQLRADLQPRSMRLNSSHIEPSHKIIQVSTLLGLERYGSPTLSDQALIPFPSVKIGPGDSARSHSPDEFIYVQEIEQGIDLYIRLLETYSQLSNE